MIFSKNIFICWMQGQEHLNTHSKAKIFNENVKNWQLLNLDWNVTLVTDTDLRQACKQFSKECLELYDSFDILHLKIDLGRYVMVYLYGGIYVDMDMYILRGLNTCDLINNLIQKAHNDIHVLGLSSLNLHLHESMLFIGRLTVINNAMMFSTQQHPLLFLMIQTIITKFTKQHTKKYRFTNSYSTIQHTTGPIFINKFFRKFVDLPLNPGKFHIEIFPHYYFEPSPPFGKSNITDNTIAIHKMELSWIPKHIQSVIKIYYNIKPIIIIPLIIPIIIISIYKYTENKVSK